jgi:RecA-family ATPase
MAIDILALLDRPRPVLDFVWPGFLAGTVGGLVAPGGTGKTFLALEAAMAVACTVTGDTPASRGDLLDLRPQYHGRVVYLHAEDPEIVIEQRMWDVLQHIPLAARDSIAENLLVEPIMGQRKNLLSEADLAPIVQFCSNARLTILDTLSRMHTGQENDNSIMARLVSQMEYIAVKTGGSSVLYLHHISKAAALNGMAKVQQAARGGGALVDNSRWCANLETMTEAEATRMTDGSGGGKPIGDERRRYVRFVCSKLNYGDSDVIADRWYRRTEGGVLVPAQIVEVGKAKSLTGYDDDESW